MMAYQAHRGDLAARNLKSSRPSLVWRTYCSHLAVAERFTAAREPAPPDTITDHAELRTWQ